MNEIKMTVELCPEDRARLDAIIDGLGALKLQSQNTIEPDDAQKALAAVLEKKNAAPTEAPKNAQDAPETLEHPTLDPFPEMPTAQEKQNEAPAEKAKPKVSMEILRSLAITLSAAGKKDQVREIVHAHASKVTDLPENVWGEVYEKLDALGE